MLTLLPFALVAVGLASTAGSDMSAWRIIAILGGLFVFLSAVSASGSLMLARRAKGRQLLEAGEDFPTLGDGSASGISAAPANPEKLESRR